MSAKQTFFFRCGNFEKKNYIYAVKFGEHSWYYFDEKDTLSSVHHSLPAVLSPLIGTLDIATLKTIKVPLNEEQARNYHADGKFVFKNKELKTHMQLVNKQVESKASKNLINTRQLVFISGQTNPLLFLNDFEKCSDLKTDKDKMFRIRNFVDEEHRVEFSELYFTSEWHAVRRAFLNKYSLRFIANKKNELKIDFNEETSLRSFLERKLHSLSLYTTLPLINQMEIALNDLPDEVENLFLINEKMNSNKAEIFEFCDSIQDLVQTMQVPADNEPEIVQNDDLNGNRMEIFNFERESFISNTAIGTARRTKRGRPSKSTISHNNQTDDSSQSSIADMIVDESSEAPGAQTHNVMPPVSMKRKRGRPRKVLPIIPEGSDSSVCEYLNEISEASTSDASRQ